MNESEQQRLVEERSSSKLREEWTGRIKQSEEKMKAAVAEKQIERQEGFQAAMHVAMQKRLAELEEKLEEKDGALEEALKAKQVVEKEKERLVAKNLALKKTRGPVKEVKKFPVGGQHAFARYQESIAALTESFTKKGYIVDHKYVGAGWRVAPALQQDAKDVYKLIAGKTGMHDGQAVLDKDILIQANGGDVSLFNQLDEDGSGDVSMREWLKFLKSMSHMGSKWLEMTLTKLRHGAASIEEADPDDNTDSRCQRRLLEEATAAFVTMAGPDGHLGRKELVQAAGEQGRNMYNKLDADRNGNVTLEEFIYHLKRTMELREKGKPGSGEDWLQWILYTIKNGGIEINRKEVERMKEQSLATLGELFEVMTVSTHGVLDAEQLSAAEGADYGLYDQVSLTNDGNPINKEAFTLAMECIYLQKEDAARGSGPRYLGDLVWSWSRSLGLDHT